LVIVFAVSGSIPVQLVPAGQDVFDVASIHRAELSATDADSIFEL
jgi:hypothetical protein